MEITVLWTEEAISELHEIFNYFNSKAGLQATQKISNTIIDRTIILEKHPRAGQREELLKNLQEEIRYLVEGNYKIVYWIEEILVIIATVFDSRQNPRKLESLKIKY